MAKRRKINISKKAYFIAIAAILISVIAVSIFVEVWAPQLDRYMRHLGTGVTGALMILAAYRLITVGYATWLSYVIPVFFLLVVPFAAVILFLVWGGTKSLASGRELVGLVGAVYTIAFLIIVGLLPSRHADNGRIETDSTDPHNRIEPRL